MTDLSITAREARPIPKWAVTAGTIVAVILAVVLANAAGLMPKGSFLNNALIKPFVDMVDLPDLFVQTIWEGFVGGVLYALIALGFVLIFKASGVFNFAQGIMVVFAGLTLVGVYEKFAGFGFTGMAAAYLAVIVALGVMFVLAVAVERVVLRPLVNQPDIILFMATFGLTYLLIGLGETIFGGTPKVMIADQLGLPKGVIDLTFSAAGSVCRCSTSPPPSSPS
jgi:branched-chain amino acid transport system permease protein